MAQHVFPQLATKADLDRLGIDLKLWLVLAMVGVAGLAIGVAKLI